MVTLPANQKADSAKGARKACRAWKPSRAKPSARARFKRPPKMQPNALVPRPQVRQGVIAAAVDDRQDERRWLDWRD
jgi:hypothetical protein